MNRALTFLIAGIIYLLWPLDVVPDFMGVVGWIDDLLVVSITVYMAMQTFKTKIRQGPPGADRPRSKRTSPPPPKEGKPKNPHVLLGVSPDASPEEIKDAYRREMAKYHPDKVAHLGEEFKEIAEQKTKDLQEAYERLKEG